MELYLPDRVIFLDTASGSRYRIDPVALTWTRLSHDPRSRLLRTEGGELWGLDREPRVGARTMVYGPSPTAGGAYRMVETTPVARIWTDVPARTHGHVPGWYHDANAPMRGELD